MVWQLREYNLITVGKIPQTQSEQPASSGNGNTPETDITSVLKDSERLWKCSKVKEAKETSGKIIPDPRVVVYCGGKCYELLDQLAKVEYKVDDCTVITWKHTLKYLAGKSHYEGNLPSGGSK